MAFSSSEMPNRPRKRARIRRFADLWRALEHRRERIDRQLFELVPATREGKPILIIEEIGSELDNEKPGSEGEL
jgi:hypothetical protein